MTKRPAVVVSGTELVAKIAMGDWEETEFKECVCPAGFIIAMAGIFLVSSSKDTPMVTLD